MTAPDPEERLYARQLERIGRCIADPLAADGADLNQKHVDMAWLLRELRLRDAEIADLQADLKEADAEEVRLQAEIASLRERVAELEDGGGEQWKEGPGWRSR